MTIIHRRRQAVDAAQPVSTAAGGAELRRISPFSATLLRLFGPSDSPDNPLVGTKYDPHLTAERELERTRRHHEGANAGWQRWDKRLHGHNPVPPYKNWSDAGPETSAPAAEDQQQNAADLP